MLLNQHNTPEVFVLVLQNSAAWFPPLRFRKRQLSTPDSTNHLVGRGVVGVAARPPAVHVRFLSRPQGQVTEGFGLQI